MKMLFIILCILITTVCGRNSTNAEFNEAPEEKILDAICRSFRKSNSTECETECDLENPEADLSDFRLVLTTSPLYAPKIKCKDGGLVNLYWKNIDDSAYFLQLSNDSFSIVTNVTTCNDFTFFDLEEYSNYTVLLWAVSASKRKIVVGETTVETSSRSKNPSPVTHFKISDIIYNDSSISAIAKWKPNEDLSCLYELVWHSDNDLDQDTISVISEPFSKELTNLKFGTSYTIHIRARTWRLGYESPKTELVFRTKTCLQFYNSLEKCRPSKPKGFDVHETVNDAHKGTYDVHLTWKKPNLLPTYYVAQFANLIENNTIIKDRKDIYANLSGDATEFVFENMNLSDYYHIGLRACSFKGCSSQAFSQRYRTALPPLIVDTAMEQWKLLVIVLVPLLTILAAVIAVNYYFIRKRKRLNREKYFVELPVAVEGVENDSIKSKSLDDGWELDPQSLRYESVIGQGAFGVVRKAHLEMKNQTQIEVAVKMLKESPNSDDIRQFTQEIDIMKSVGQHPFIVSLIGCVTEGRASGPLLVVEYCSRGDLQTYLRDAWMHLCELQQEIDNAEEIQCFANQTYDLDNLNSEGEFLINPKYLVSIARQVALGMEYLAKTRVVHRDLAARNVLVCKNHTVKVSDFGMSRDVYQDNVYCKSSRSKVPIRWMAIESLTHQRYTTQSDVWSFGILLWEIVTLGETPYGSMHSSDLLVFLKSGNRMGRPDNCSEELYSIMQSCWRASPKNRPTFTELCKSLEELLENVADYLKLENITYNSDSRMNFTNISPSLSSTEYYIKPVNNAD